MDMLGKTIREELKIMILCLLFAAAVAYWVYKDANERGSDSAFLWAVKVFALMIVFLPLYLINRPPKKVSKETEDNNVNVAKNLNSKACAAGRGVKKSIEESVSSVEIAELTISYRDKLKPILELQPNTSVEKIKPIAAREEYSSVLDKRSQENSKACSN